MFSITDPKSATLTNVNPRNEKHGEADVLAVDVSFRLALAASELAMFHAELPGMLYLPPDEAQQAMPGVPNVSTRLRCAEVKPVALKASLAGRNVGILLATSSIALPTSKVEKFLAEAKEGGTVELSFIVKCSGVTGAVVGQLSDLLNHDVELTISESTAAEGDGQVGANGAAAKTSTDDDLLSAGAKTATDAFVDAHAGGVS